MLRQIGQNVKAARLKANLTQECLAELSGVHWQTISYLENGRFPALLTTFTRITMALGVSADQLLQGLSAPDPRQMEKVKKAMARKRKPRRID